MIHVCVYSVIDATARARCIGPYCYCSLGHKSTLLYNVLTWKLSKIPPSLLSDTSQVILYPCHTCDGCHADGDSNFAKLIAALAIDVDGLGFDQRDSNPCECGDRRVVFDFEGNEELEESLFDLQPT